MKLSSKRHGKVNAFYYTNPAVFYTYALSGHTIAERLNWMFKHITERTDLNKGDLKLVADEDGGVRMINRKTGGRLYIHKIGRTNAVWLEEKVPDMATMHEEYEYNQ
jgi:hypothetical protein